MTFNATGTGDPITCMARTLTEAASLLHPAVAQAVRRTRASSPNRRSGLR